MKDRPSSPVGAYGLEIRGLDDARALLVPAEPGWPTLTVERSVQPDANGADDESEWATARVTETGAEIVLSHGTHVFLERAPLKATFVTPRPLGQHELVHPYLGAVGAVAALWLGRQCFHAGAFAVPSGVWAVLAEREGGKSSLLAWLDRRDVPIVADDILVVEDGNVYAGPRSIDLRADPARELGLGEALGVVGVRERWRHAVAPAPSSLPLRGWIQLRWGEGPTVRALAVGERLATLAANVALARPPEDPRVLLELAALPGFELRRPRGWDGFSTAAAVALELATA